MAGACGPSRHLDCSPGRYDVRVPTVARSSSRTLPRARTRFTRLTSSQRRPASRRGVPDTLSPRTSPKKSRDFGQSGRPGDERIKPIPPSRGVVWPRGAPYGLRARPWRPWPHPVARPRPGDRVDRGTNSIRRRRARGRRSPALAPPVRGAPLQLPRVVDRRSSSRSELPSM